MARITSDCPTHGKRRSAMLSALILLSAALPLPLASSTNAIHAPATAPTVLSATATVNALLLGQEYSLFYSGFEH